MTARPQDVAPLPDLDEWLRGCPDPSKVSPEWMVKKPSRLLWRCRDAFASAQAREDELRAEVEAIAVELDEFADCPARVLTLAGKLRALSTNAAQPGETT